MTRVLRYTILVIVKVCKLYSVKKNNLIPCSAHHHKQTQHFKVECFIVYEFLWQKIIKPENQNIYLSLFMFEIGLLLFMKIGLKKTKTLYTISIVAAYMSIFDYLCTIVI